VAVLSKKNKRGGGRGQASTRQMAKVKIYRKCRCGEEGRGGGGGRREDE
jgi:hypothetical protein